MSLSRFADVCDTTIRHRPASVVKVSGCFMAMVSLEHDLPGGRDRARLTQPADGQRQRMKSIRRFATSLAAAGGADVILSTSNSSRAKRKEPNSFPDCRRLTANVVSKSNTNPQNAISFFVRN